MNAMQFMQMVRSGGNPQAMLLNMLQKTAGKSPMKRKMYMESKDMHHDSSKTMQELEDYMNELTSDMMEMIDKATPDEKSTLQKKIKTLSEKVQNV